MKAALVGLGYWGKTILPILKSLEKSLNFKLQHVCDHHEENIREYKKKYPSISIHTDFDELLHGEQLDLVFITTGVGTHYDLVRKSLENNCHIFVEKPFVTRLSHARELNDIAISKSLTLMVGHRLLYSPSIQWLKKKVFEKGVPDGTVFEASWKNWGIHQPRGVHWDLACHYIAVLDYLIAKKTELISVNPISNHSSWNPENISIILKYPGDIISKIDVSWNNPIKVKELIIKIGDQLIYINHEGDYPLSIYNAKANIEFSENRNGYESVFELQKKFDKKKMNEMQTIEGQFTDFIQCAKTSRQVLASANLAANVVETLCKIDGMLYNT